jgi:serine/threonine-protein kinase
MGSLFSPPSIDAAIDSQAARTERVVALGGLIAGLVAVAITLVIWTTIRLGLTVADPKTITGVMCLCFGWMLWYLIVLLALQRGIGQRWLPWVDSIIEASFPGALMAIEVMHQPPAFVAFTTLAQLGYAVVFTLAMMRLRWQIPLMVGAIGALEYGALLAYVVPTLPTLGLDRSLTSSVFFYFRPVLLLSLGGVGALVVRRMRTTVGEAHGQVRSRELFGKYRLGERLAAGGMGEVFRATYCPEGGFQKQVAIKRVHPHLASNAQFVEAFRHEAELCSRLTHANIVQVLDFGLQGDTYFLAMEFVDGLTLSELLRRCRAAQTPLPPSMAAWIGRRIAQALAFAHAEARDADGHLLRVIHRDLSPSNVLLSKAGEVKVTDFGIAKVLGDKLETTPTTVAGKVPYMAPEQLLGQPLDERCDLFALGAVIWETLCGRRLFQSNTDAATGLEVLNKRVPPPSTIRTDLRSNNWDALFERALNRDKDGRFPNAMAMVEALERLALEEGSTNSDDLGNWVVRALEQGPPPPEDWPPKPAELHAPGEMTATAPARSAVTVREKH